MATNGDSLRVALVTPFSWGTPSAVNAHVADLARELRARGHRPVVVTSTDGPAELLRTRELCRRRCQLLLTLLPAWLPGEDPDPGLLPLPGSGPLAPEEGIPVVSLGRSIPFRLNGSVTNIGLPLDLRSRLEAILAGGGFDLVHVHEPVAPSLAFTAVREARSPVVATFHLSPLGLLGYELGRNLLDRFYQRLDRRLVASTRGAEVLQDFLPGEYAVVSPGTRLPSSSAEDTGPRGGGSVLYVYRGDDRRGLRAYLRALAGQLPPHVDHLVVAVHSRSADIWGPRAAPRRVASRVSWHEFEDTLELAPLYRQAAAVVLPYLGGEWLQASLVEAVRTGCPFLAPDLPGTRRLVVEEGGLLFSPGQESTLLGALTRLTASGTDQARVQETALPLAARHGMDQVAAEVLALYQETLSRPKEGDASRSTPARTSSARARGPVPAPGGWIHADLHIHTEYSKDCTSPVEAVLATARDVGLGAVAIADHNTIAGGLAARELAGDDLFVIVASEIKTANGEVIGLFLEEEILGGLPFEETLSLIKAQGGLVYIPHPFDSLRTTPSYRSMVDNLYRIDAVETYNARVFHSSFNLNAERFAAKYHLPAGAGSDAHVLPGIGTALLRMPRFRTPEEFLAGLREADIVRRRKSLLYLQSLKLLQNTLDHVFPAG